MYNMDDRQKRLKVGRACYSCRVKKIKCDGLQPCMQCKARRKPCTYSKDGTYSPTSGDNDIVNDVLPTSTSNGTGASQRDSSAQLFMQESRSAYKKPSKMDDDSEAIIDLLSEAVVQLSIHNSSPDLVSGLGTILHLEPVWNHEPDLPESYAGSLELPSFEMQQNLLDIYFRYRYGFFPLIPKHFLVKQVREKGLLISPLLLNAIFAHAALHATDWQQNGQKGDPTVVDGDAFILRAKGLMGDFTDEKRISTLYAFSLMSIYESESNGWDYSTNARLYCSMAVQMALELNLHRKPSAMSNMDPVNIETRKRLLWGVYVLDKIHALIAGQPAHLRKQDIIIDYPSILEDDDMEERSIVESFTKLIQLAEVCETLISMTSSASHQKESRIKDLHSVDVQLSSWLADLPAHLQWQAFQQTQGTDAGLTFAENPLATNLHFFWNVIALLLLKPFSRSSNHNIRQKCFNFAANVARLAMFMAENRQLIFMYSLTSFGAMMAAATFICYFDHPNKLIGEQAMQLFQSSLKALKTCMRQRSIPGVKEFIKLLEGVFGTDLRSASAGAAAPLRGVAVSSGEDSPSRRASEATLANIHPMSRTPSPRALDIDMYAHLSIPSSDFASPMSHEAAAHGQKLHRRSPTHPYLFAAANPQAAEADPHTYNFQLVDTASIDHWARELSMNGPPDSLHPPTMNPISSAGQFMYGPTSTNAAFVPFHPESLPLNPPQNPSDPSFNTSAFAATLRGIQRQRSYSPISAATPPSLSSQPWSTKLKGNTMILSPHDSSNLYAVANGATGWTPSDEDTQDWLAVSK